MENNTTICGVATARGLGGVAIVRISGPEALRILSEAFCPAGSERAYPPRKMQYGRVTDDDGGVIDEAMAVFMPGPRSYTREDVAEIQCHGGDTAARRTLNRVLALGAIPAGPGEFTKRAFLNGRIDLSRAEAVMELIGAGSEASARASVRQLEGGVSGFVRDISRRIMSPLSIIEASTDYPDEVEEEAAAGQVSKEIREIIREIDRRCDPRRARIVREGASVVLAGKPNVGKSSLMNALLNQERAIVTEIPGTTRDVLTERMMIGGVVVELSDTAGRRQTDDPVERIGVNRARHAVESADVVLIVIDVSEPLSREDVELLEGADERAILCLNKTDLPPVVTGAELLKCTDALQIEISASSGEGVDALVAELEARLAGAASEDSLTVERHIRLAGSARSALAAALESIEQGVPLDVAAIDLKSALNFLAEITAENPTEALIDEIFSRFCVGK
ncbi:MAG: tRNA uridine-5-carboxymethylaminomethyl(34) synthesis GTPase MnmE [Christensenellales bacterium]|nr:tRNA uridine-5-carboxymethylaminomethyl(34) synthesis GTPase MnmE [Christensenellales bacterium]